MTRNPATVTVRHGDDGWLIATCSRPGRETMGHLMAALNAIPGIDDITPQDEGTGQIAFKMFDRPTLEELAEELTAWVA